jgi:RNA polymerase sigma-70 factor (ECF subfamily)
MRQEECRKARPVDTKRGDTLLGEGLHAACDHRLCLLMARAQDGDRDAFRTLLENILPQVRAFLRRRLLDASELEDLCQETLLAFYQARRTYDPARPVEPWLFAIARNVAAEHRRSHTRRTRWLELVDAPPERPGDIASGAWARLQEALERLPRTQREAFTLLKLDGMTVVDAARQAGVKTNALRVRAHRAYQSLKIILMT